ncbi:MAG: hypothetical protein ACJAZX_000823 [Rickettsiales bacterium]|jgi:hypothetical protein
MRNFMMDQREDIQQSGLSKKPVKGKPTPENLTKVSLDQNPIQEKKHLG